MIKQVWCSIFCIIAIGFLSTGCGGGSSSAQKTVDLTVMVPTTGTLQKGKSLKTVSILSVKGKILADDKEVNAKENGENFVIKVPEGADVHIQATITDENGSEFTFECYVDNATESTQVVDEDSTRVANLLVYDGVKNNSSVKDLLLSDRDVIGDWKIALASFQSRDAVNDLLENSNSEESVDALAVRVENLISELKEINRILAIFEGRLEAFANSNDVIKFGAFSEVDVHSNVTTDEGDTDVINEFLARPAGVKNIAAGESTSAVAAITRPSVFINEDGTISVEKDGEFSTTDSVLTKDRLSGSFLGFSESVLVIAVKQKGSVAKEDFYISTDDKVLTALAESFVEGDSITVSFTENDKGEKVAKSIFAEGFLSGKLTELSKTSVTIELSNGSSVTLPIKRYSDKIIFIMPPEFESAKISPIVKMPFETDPTVRMPFDGEKKPKPDVESTDPIFETTTIEESTEGDNEVSITNTDEIFETISVDVKIGDLVIIHWKIIENVKYSVAIYPDLPISIDDPINETESSGPIKEGDEVTKDDDSGLLIRQ